MEEWVLADEEELWEDGVEVYEIDDLDDFDFPVAVAKVALDGLFSALGLEKGTVEYA